MKKTTKKKHAKVSIGVQLLIAFLIPVIFVVLVGVQAYQSASEGMSDQFQESTAETLKMTVEYVDLGCEFISVEGIKYAFNDNLSKYYLGLYNDDPIALMNAVKEADDMIAATKQTNSFVSDIHIIPKKGTNFLSTYTPKTSSNVSRDGFYEELLAAFKETYSSGRVPNWVDTVPLIGDKMQLDQSNVMMSYVVQSSNNNAYVVVDMSSDKIKEILQGIDFGEGSIVGLVTSSGKESLSGTEETNLFYNLECYQQGLESGEAIGMQEIDYAGQEYLYIYSQSDTDTFTICALVPKSTVTGQADSIKSVTVAMVLLAIIVAALVGILISMRMVGNMSKIMKTMTKVAEGNLTVKTKEKGIDEFALLAGEMNHMVSNTKDLVQQVAVSTERMEVSTKAVNQASELIEDYSENITSAISEIHTGMNVQAENAQECLMTTDTLSQEIQNISERVEEIEKNIRATGDRINEGMHIMHKLASSAQQTSEVTEKVSQNILSLQEEFEQIQGFVDTIDAISEETNLLSLNASIEAARAGESGRGFAVVADQIRKLADGSAQAASEIQKTVEGIRSQTDASVSNAQIAKDMVLQQGQAVEDVQVSFHSMQQDMNAVIERMKQIVENTEKADSVREATLQAIQNISAVIEETAAAAAVVNETAENLLEHVEGLHKTAGVMGENMSTLKEGIAQFKTEE